MNKAVDRKVSRATKNQKMMALSNLTIASSVHTGSLSIVNNASTCNDIDCFTITAH